MARVYDNWERLVRATLRREQLRQTGPGHARKPSGIAGSVPDSLQRTTNINAILQAADEIQDEDPNVARICKLYVHLSGFNLCVYYFLACLLILSFPLLFFSSFDLL